MLRVFEINLTLILQTHVYFFICYVYHKIETNK